MANTNNISAFNYNMVNNRRIELKVFLWIVFIFVYMILYFFTSNIYISIYVFLISLFFVKNFYLKPIAETFKSGYIGEKNALNTLRKLPKSFIIFNSIEIPSENSTFKEYETDFIVVGKNSCFIIETKSYTGIIHCDNEKRDWLKEEYTRNGKLVRSFIIKSPFSQVRNQIKVLQYFLKSFNITIDVFPLVFLNMKKENYHLPANHEIPVFNNKSINRFIKKVDENRNSFNSEQDRESFIEILTNLNKLSIKSRKDRLKDKNYLKDYLRSNYYENYK